jgi:hypothetical protein
LLRRGPESERVEATGVSKGGLYVVGDRYVVRVGGAQATGDEIARFSADTPLQSLPDVHEGVRQDISPVDTDIDLHPVDGTLDPTRPEALRGGREAPAARRGSSAAKGAACCALDSADGTR